LVDLAFIVDHAGSLSSEYDAVKSAAQQFVSYFDPDKDRVALAMFATSTVIMDPINTGGHGFDKSSLLNHIGGDGIAFVSTATAEGLYAGWDQLRSVSSGSQAGLRVIVLFTDGAPNTFTGQLSLEPCHVSTQTLFPATGALSTTVRPPTARTSHPALTE